jgi:tRNA synthetases class I (E and Q), anti-codon binding domain
MFEVTRLLPTLGWAWRTRRHPPQSPHCVVRFIVQLEADDEVKDYVSKDSWHEAAALGDANMRALQAGDVVQLERRGYFRVDEALTAAGKPLLLFAIPDGRAKKG